MACLYSKTKSFKETLYSSEFYQTPSIYCDCALVAQIEKIIEEDKEFDLIQGFTTNPTLMKQAGVVNYLKFAESAITLIRDKKPSATLSLEVFSDNFAEMFNQALTLHTLAKELKFDNLFIKIPITNSLGKSSEDLVAQLSFSGVRVNVTAVFTGTQIVNIQKFLSPKTSSFISVFAGRIADTGINPVTCIDLGKVAKQTLNGVVTDKNPMTKYIWASPREVYHFDMAKTAGYDIITMTPELINKLKENRYKSLTQFSLETVQMFVSDAQKAGYTI